MENKEKLRTALLVVTFPVWFSIIAVMVSVYAIGGLFTFFDY